MNVSTLMRYALRNIFAGSNANALWAGMMCNEHTLQRHPLTIYTHAEIRHQLAPEYDTRYQK